MKTQKMEFPKFKDIKRDTKALVVTQYIREFEKMNHLKPAPFEFRGKVVQP